MQYGYFRIQNTKRIVSEKIRNMTSGTFEFGFRFFFFFSFMYSQATWNFSNDFTALNKVFPRKKKILHRLTIVTDL